MLLDKYCLRFIRALCAGCGAVKRNITSDISYLYVLIIPNFYQDVNIKYQTFANNQDVL